MDVTCERCRTVYEFDDTLVSPRGTTVKCTSCGHLFKVRRNGVTPVSDETRPWVVRHEDGTVEPLTSIGELTEMITRGAVGREAEISRAGQGWKRLGDIAELEAFFAVTGAKRGARVSTPALGLSPLSQPDESIPPPRPDGETPPRTAAEALDDDADAETTAPHKPSRALTPLPAPPAPVTRSAPAARFVRSQAWIFAAFCVGAVVALAIWEGRNRWWSDPPNPAAEYVARAQAALDGHRTAAFEEASIEYTKALAFDERAPDVLAALSGVHAIWAQALRFHADDLKALQGAASPQALTLTQQAERHASLAARHAREARRAARDGAPPQIAVRVALAHADALRLGGDLEAARAALPEPRAVPKDLGPERLRIAALLEGDAQGDLAAGRAQASRARRAAPESIRITLLHARTLLAADDYTAAAKEVQQVLARATKHPEGRRLGRVIAARQQARERSPEEARASRDARTSEAPPEQAAAEAAAGAAPRSAGAAPAKAASPGARAAHPAKTAPKASAVGRAEPSEGTAPPGNDMTDSERAKAYRGQVARGEAALERGEIGSARQAFQSALALRSDGAAARTGMGYLALEAGRPAAAVGLFRRAANAGHAEAYIGLGEAYRRLERPTDALRAYEAYLTHSPNGPSLSVARRQIERLREEMPLAQPATPRRSIVAAPPAEGSGRPSLRTEPTSPYTPETSSDAP